MREAKDPAQAYLNPQPSIASHEDITRFFEAYLRRFTAWAQGGLPKCVFGGRVVWQHTFAALYSKVSYAD